jgi:hypothetical protein
VFFALLGKHIQIDSVDGGLLFTPIDEILDFLLGSLHSEFKFPFQGDFVTYLCLEIEMDSVGSSELSLIKWIIAAAGVEENSTQHENQATDILHGDSTGPERCHHWYVELSNLFHTTWCCSSMCKIKHSSKKVTQACCASPHCLKGS